MSSHKDDWIYSCQNPHEANKNFFKLVRRKAQEEKNIPLVKYASCEEAYEWLSRQNSFFMHSAYYVGKISSIEPIKGFQNIEEFWDTSSDTQINSMKNEVNSYGPLSTLRNLRDLRLSKDRINLRDFSSHKNLKELTIYNLENENNWQALSGLSSLTGLWVYNTCNVDLSPISRMENLEEACVSYEGSMKVQIDFTPLLRMKKLVRFSFNSFVQQEYIIPAELLDGRIDFAIQVLWGEDISKFLRQQAEDSRVGDFYASLMERPKSEKEFRNKLYRLSFKVENTHHMKLFYTYVMNEFRMGHIPKEVRNRHLRNAFENVSSSVVCPKTIRAYKLTLKKALSDEVISQGDMYELDSIAEDNKTFNDPKYLSLVEHVKKHASKIQNLEESVEKVHKDIVNMNRSLIQVKLGLKKKIEIEAGVGVMSIILSAVSFGFAGPPLQGVAASSIEDIVDFGDIEHILEIALGSSADLAHQVYGTVNSDKLLERSLSSKDGLGVFYAIATPVSNYDPSFTMADAKIIQPSDDKEADVGFSDGEEGDLGFSDGEEPGLGNSDSEETWLLGFSDDEEEDHLITKSTFNAIDSDNHRALIEIVSKIEDKKQMELFFQNQVSFKQKNAIKYAVEHGKTVAVQILASKAKELEIISAQKLDKYIKLST